MNSAACLAVAARPPGLARATHLLRICAFAFAATFSIPAAHAQTKGDVEYVAGFGAWQQERYPVASDHLSRYRIGVPYGKSYDVDYLLGTSWCRMDGLAAKGANLLDWAMQQDMPVSAAKQFALEIRVCRDLLSNAAPRPERPSLLARTNTGAGASVRASGKLFYFVGRETSPLAAVPLDLVRPRSEAEYESRIVPLGRPDAAVPFMGERLPPGYRALVIGRFVFASKTHSDSQLREIAARLESFVAFLGSEYDITFPNSFVDIYLCETPADLVKLAMDVHGLRASELTLGYTFQNDLSIAAVMRGTAAGTLLHELFHLGVRSSFGDIPSWLDESIASLYETSTEMRGRYLGDPNWRGEVLKSMGGARRFRLEDLVGYLSADRVAASGPGATPIGQTDEGTYQAATGRYFALYLQEKGKLKAVYDAFRDKPTWALEMPAKAASVRLIEEKTEMPSAVLRTAFASWLEVEIDQRPPTLPGREGGVPVAKEIPTEFQPGNSPSPGASAPRSIAEQIMQRR